MKSVLLIDDDKVVRKVMARFLTASGWRVIEAEDGVEGIALALAKRPQVVVCDLLMPRCNGFHVCRELREHATDLPGLRIVVTTYRAFGVDRVNALESGADEFLTKPVSREVLLAAVDGRTVAARAGPEVAQATTLPETAELHGAGFLRFWGVRGSIPTPGPSTVFYGGNTSCVELRADGELIILDAGSGLRVLGEHLLGEFRGQALNLTLLLTHTHWDHIQGFPFFAPAYQKTNQVRVLGYEGARAGLANSFEVQMESPYFPIGLRQMPGNIAFEELREMRFRVGSVRGRAAFVNHPGVTVGYRLQTKRATVAYIPDHESYTRMRLHAQGAPEEVAEARKLARREERQLEKFVRGADVLILDSQYTAEEYETKIGWGHSCFEDTVTTAAKAGVKRLFLFHHDPGRGDDDVSRMVSRARRIAARLNPELIVESAREGLVCPL